GRMHSPWRRQSTTTETKWVRLGKVVRRPACCAPSAKERAMATVRVGSIVLRVDDLQRQMAFWMAALDYVPREDPDVDSVVLLPRTGSGPNLTLDQHPAP